MSKSKEVVREHDCSYMAVHRETGKLFGGKGRGTSTGYNQKRFLKSAMTEAKVNHDDYYIISLSIKDHLPELSLIEGTPITYGTSEQKYHNPEDAEVIQKLLKGDK